MTIASYLMWVEHSWNSTTWIRWWESTQREHTILLCWQHISCKNFRGLIIDVGATVFLHITFHANFSDLDKLTAKTRINKSLTLNCRSTQCHWPRTLEWGGSIRPCMLIHRHIKFPFSCPKLILKKSPTLLYQELPSLFTNISCFSPKQNAVLLKMLP